MTQSNSRDHIFALVSAERARQEEKFPGQKLPLRGAEGLDQAQKDAARLVQICKASCEALTKDGRLHWIAVLEEEVMEAYCEMLADRPDLDRVLAELIQVMAVCSRIIEQIGPALGLPLDAPAAPVTDPLVEEMRRTVRAVKYAHGEARKETAEAQEKLKGVRRELAAAELRYNEICERLGLDENAPLDRVLGALSKLIYLRKCNSADEMLEAEQQGRILEIRRPGHDIAVAVYLGHCWGRPVVTSSRGVAVEDIVSRVRAGDTIEAVAADMDIDLEVAREAFTVGYVLEYGRLPGEGEQFKAEDPRVAARESSIEREVREADDAAKKAAADLSRVVKNLRLAGEPGETLEELATFLLSWSEMCARRTWGEAAQELSVGPTEEASEEASVPLARVYTDKIVERLGGGAAQSLGVAVTRICDAHDVLDDRLNCVEKTLRDALAGLLGEAAVHSPSSGVPLPVDKLAELAALYLSGGGLKASLKAKPAHDEDHMVTMTDRGMVERERQAREAAKAKADEPGAAFKLSKDDIDAAAIAPLVTKLILRARQEGRWP